MDVDCRCDCVSASHQHPSSTAPDLEGIIRKRAEAEALKVLAIDTGVDASLLGKFINGTGALKLEDVSKLMTRLQLKPVDKARVCVRPEELAFLRRLHATVNEHAAWLLNEAEA